MWIERFLRFGLGGYGCGLGGFYHTGKAPSLCPEIEFWKNETIFGVSGSFVFFEASIIKSLKTPFNFFICEYVSEHKNFLLDFLNLRVFLFFRVVVLNLLFSLKFLCSCSPQIVESLLQFSNFLLLDIGILQNVFIEFYDGDMFKQILRTQPLAFLTISALL